VRFLITGVTGFVGPYLANELADEPGVELFGMAWNGNDHATAALLPAGLETLTGDITDDGSIHEVLEAARPEVVVHLAAPPPARRPGGGRPSPSRSTPSAPFACSRASGGSGSIRRRSSPPRARSTAAPTTRRTR